MTKGTASKGKKQNPVHGRCRRCGRHAYHLQKRRCSSCGYGATAKLRGYAWAHKAVNR